MTQNAEKYAIDVTDTIQINAPKALVFRELANYPGISQWFAGYSCEFLDGAKAIAPGVQVRHTLKNMGFTLSDFVRIIQKVQPNERIEETYDRGSMTGKGIWTFTEKDGVTTANYLCQVNATGWLFKIVFALVGNSAHSGTFKKLLAGLKAHCEALHAQAKSPAK